MQSKEQKTIIVIGSQQSGKTALVQRLVDDQFPEDYQPTMAINFFSKDTAQHCLMFRDVTGDPRVPYFKTSYCRDAAVVLIAFDLTSKDSFIEAKKDLGNVHQAAPNAKKILVGTKSDVSNGIAYEEEITTFCDENALTYYKTSSKNGRGIQELLGALNTSSFLDQLEVTIKNLASGSDLPKAQLTELHTLLTNVAKGADAQTQKDVDEISRLTMDWMKTFTPGIKHYDKCLNTLRFQDSARQHIPNDTLSWKAVGDVIARLCLTVLIGFLTLGLGVGGMALTAVAGYAFLSKYLPSENQSAFFKPNPGIQDKLLEIQKNFVSP